MIQHQLRLECLKLATQLATNTQKEQKVKFVLDTAEEFLKWVTIPVNTNKNFESITQRLNHQQYVPPRTGNPIKPPFEVTCSTDDDFADLENLREK